VDTQRGTQASDGDDESFDDSSTTDVDEEHGDANVFTEEQVDEEGADDAGGDDVGVADEDRDVRRRDLTPEEQATQLPPVFNFVFEQVEDRR
jgi:hypothetical protein